MRPDGRLVIGDIHFGTLARASDDPNRTGRALRARDGHFRDGAVPATFLSCLPKTGSRHVSSAPVTFADAKKGADGIVMMPQWLVAEFAVSGGAIPEAVARAWSEELHRRADAGSLIFTITDPVTVAEAI